MGELVGGDLGRVDREEVVAVLAREMGLETAFRPALFQDLQRDLLKIDEVRTHSRVVSTLPLLLSTIPSSLSLSLSLSRHL